MIRKGGIAAVRWECPLDAGPGLPGFGRKIVPYPVEETAMTKPAAFALFGLALAGCASPGDTQVASAECKVVPITTASASGRAPKNVSAIEQRWAEMQLAGTDYRQRQLQERGMFDNNIEQALRDCQR